VNQDTAICLRGRADIGDIFEWSISLTRCCRAFVQPQSHFPAFLNCVDAYRKVESGIRS